MASTHLGACTPLASQFYLHKHKFKCPIHLETAPFGRTIKIGNGGISLRIRASSDGGGGDSYLGMWKKAVENEKKAVGFQKIVENSAKVDVDETNVESVENLEKKSQEFEKILEVSKEERDRIQRIQVIDRAAAAIAAARALLKESGLKKDSGSGDVNTEPGTGGVRAEPGLGGLRTEPNSGTIEAPEEGKALNFVLL